MGRKLLILMALYEGRTVLRMTGGRTIIIGEERNKVWKEHWLGTMEEEKEGIFVFMDLAQRSWLNFAILW